MRHKHSYELLSHDIHESSYQYSKSVRLNPILYSLEKVHIVWSTVKEVKFFVRAAKTFYHETLVTWRSYQVFTVLLNIVFGPVFNPVLVGGWSALVIIGVFTGLKLGDVVPPPIYMFFILIAFDGITAICTFIKVCGEVNELSKNVLGHWKTLAYKSAKPKLVTRQLKSCQDLRIKLGSTNFFDMSTSLVTIDFCVDQIVRLLIAS